MRFLRGWFTAKRWGAIGHRFIEALRRLAGSLFRKLGGVIARHPAPACGTAFAVLAVVILSLSPHARGFYTTGPYGGGDHRADLECLALNIYHEARGETRFGKFAVGHVVINRVRDPRFPDTVCGVVKQGGEAPLHDCQFSWWCDGRSDQPRDTRAWRESMALASLVYSGRAKDPTGGALWYHADFVEPSWRTSLTKGHTIGRHIFYHAGD